MPDNADLASLYVGPLFWRRKLGLGAGPAAWFTEAPAGNPAFLDESQGFPQKEAEPDPWKDHRLKIPGGAALSLRPSRPPKWRIPFVFEKSEGGPIFYI
jgi:hypothetical protein